MGHAPGWYDVAKSKGLINDTQAGTSGPSKTAPIYPTEKAFQTAVIQLATSRGWLCYHTYDSRRCTPGFPDLILLRAGVMVVAELKVDSKVTESQQEWLTAFAVTGAATFVWRPEDHELIEETLK